MAGLAGRAVQPGSPGPAPACAASEAQSPRCPAACAQPRLGQPVSRLDVIGVQVLVMHSDACHASGRLLDGSQGIVAATVLLGCLWRADRLDVFIRLQCTRPNTVPELAQAGLFGVSTRDLSMQHVHQMHGQRHAVLMYDQETYLYAASQSLAAAALVLCCCSHSHSCQRHVHTCARAGRQRQSPQQQPARGPGGRSAPTAAVGGVLRWEPRTWKLPLQLLWACCRPAAPSPVRQSAA